MATYSYGDLYVTDVDGDYNKLTVNDRDCSSAVFSQITTVDDKISANSIKTGKVCYTGSMKAPKMKLLPEIEKVIFNDPATVVIWSDGTKTIVKTRQKGRKKDKFSKEYGLAIAIAKKYCGNRCRFLKLVKEAKNAG